MSEVDREVRRAHYGHERSIQWVGLAWILAGCGAGLLAFVGLTQGDMPLWLGAVLSVFAVSITAIAVRLRALDPRARLPALALATLVFFWFPFGTMIALPALFIVLSKKGRTVLGTDYARVVASTKPEGRPPWALALLIVGLLLGLFVAIALPSYRW